MSLTIVSGLPGSGRPDYVIELLSQAARAGRSALLVVPDSGSATEWRERISESVPVGVRVGSFEGVIQREWALRGDGRAIADPLQQRLLAARAMREVGIADGPSHGASDLLIALASRRASVGSSLGVTAGGLAGRLLDALRAYGSALADGGLIDLEEATGALAAAPAPSSVIGFVGFTSLRPAAERLLTGWALRSEVAMELPWRDGTPGTQAIDTLVERFRTSGAEVVDLGVPRDGRPEELARIAVDLFAGTQPKDATGRVTAGVVVGDEAEARLAVASVKEALARGVAPEQVAVAFPDLTRHAAWMAHALRESGVPAVMDAEHSTTETPFGRALLRLWALCARGFARLDAVAFLRSPFSGEELKAADELDARLRRSPGMSPRTALSGSARARSLIDRCTSLAVAPVDRVTAQKWKNLADTLLANAYPGAAPTPDSAAAIDAGAHRVFCRVLARAVELGPDVATANDLIESFASARVRSVAAITTGCVLVTSLRRLAGQSFAHVVIGGLSASEFPRRESEERMEGESVARVARLLGIAAEPDSHAQAERLAFYLGVTAARDSLALIRRKADDEGGLLRESVFWDEFLDLYRAPDVPEEGVLPPVHEEPVRPTAGPPRRPRGLVADPRTLERLGATDVVSPSEVERYAGCPYRWFVESRIRPETPDVSFDVAAAGTLAHTALAEFNRRAVKRWPRVTAANVEEALGLASECFTESLAGMPRPVSLDEERLFADVWPAVERMVRQDAAFLPGFAPAHVEWSFGGPDDEPEDLGGVRLKGRADRVDVGPGGLVVVDYKRSSAYSLADIRREPRLQLQLYAAVASRRLGLPIAGGVYRNMKTGETRGFVREDIGEGFTGTDVVSCEEIDAIVADALRAANEAVAGMRAGVLEPAPDVARCRYCAAATFCPEAVR